MPDSFKWHSSIVGGLGGVHRGGETTMDVSADLTELGRNPVAVVSSGVKSILDIEKTLEYLVSCTQLNLDSHLMLNIRPIETLC